jgi:hypothetical protein
VTRNFGTSRGAPALFSSVVAPGLQNATTDVSPPALIRE